MTPEIEIVRIPVAPAEAHRLVQAIEHARLGYFAAPACVGVELLLSDGRDELAAIITWATAEAHLVRQQTPAAASFFQAVTDLAAGKPEIKHYHPASVAE